MKKNPITNLRKLVSASLVAAPAFVVPASLWAAASPLPDVSKSNLDDLKTKGILSYQTTDNGTAATLNISITNGSTNNILTWGTFDLGAAGTVNYNQTNASSAVLNKVTGTAASVVDGSIMSNGRVFLLNPNGITIGATAQINTAEFVASTINDTDADTYFTQNNDLSYTGATAGALTINNSAVITSKGNVVFAGRDIVAGGNVTGNLQIKSLTTGSDIELGNLTVSGNLDVKTYGGDIDYVSGEDTVTIGGAASSFNTAGNLVNGDVFLGNSLNFTKTGAVLSVDTAGVYNLSKGDFALYGNSNVLKTLKLITGEASIEATSDVDLGASEVTHLYVGTTGGSITNSGEVAVDGYIDLEASKAITFNGSGSGDVSLDAGTSIAFTGSVGDDLDATAGTTLAITGSIGDDLVASAGTKLTLTGSVDGDTNVTGTESVTVAGTGDFNFTGLSAQTITVSTDGKITLPFIYPAKDVSLTSTGDTVVMTEGIYNSGALSITTAKDFTLSREIGDGATHPETVVINSGGKFIGASNWEINSTKSTSITAAGDVALSGVINAPALSVKSTGGSITQVAALTNADASFDAAKAITLNAANDFGTLSLMNWASGSAVSVTDANTVSIKAADVAGAATVTAGGTINLGSAATDSVKFNGKLTVAGSAAIDVASVAKNITVGGDLVFGANINNVSITTSGNSFGTIKGDVAVDALITEAADTDLGALTVGQDLTVRSTGGNVTDSGVVTVGRYFNVSAGAKGAVKDITLDAANKFGNTIVIGNDGTDTGIAGVVAINNTLLTDIGASKVATSLTVTSGANLTDSGVIEAPVATFNAKSGYVTLDNGTKFATVTLNSAGATLVEADDITVNGNQTGALSVTTTKGSVVLDSITSTAGVTVNTSNTAGKTITDSTGNLAIQGNVSFLTKAAAISVTGANHNFGGVSLNTAWNGGADGADITFTEGGVLRFMDVNAGSKGNLTAIAGGGILMRDAGNQIVVAKNATFTTGGFIDLKSAAAAFTVGGNATYTAGGDISVGLGSTTGNIVASGAKVDLTNVAGGNYTVTATGNSSITTTGAAKLNNISTGTGTLTVGAGAAVTQVSGSKIIADGAVTINAAGQAITLANDGNRFGAVSATGASLNIVEETTLNLKTVTVGTLTAKSLGDIVNSGAVSATGVTTLTAGSITLDNAGNKFDQILATSTGSLKITDSTGNLQINGGTTVGGDLVLKSSVSSGTISDFGVITVAGNATFDAANGYVNVVNPNSSYAGLVFKAAGVQFVQNGDVKLLGGSKTTGDVLIQSAKGSITSEGASTFNHGLELISAKDITFIDPSMIIGGALVVNAPGVSDLSVLSKAANLGGTSPVNEGTGTVVAPKP